MQFGFAAAVQAFKDSRRRGQRSELAAHRRGDGRRHRRPRARSRRTTAKWLEAKSPRKISPFFIPGSIINVVAGHVSIHFGLRGPNIALVTACTTSTHCDRHRRPHDPVRRRRRHGGRRRGDGVHAARPRQLRPGARAVAAQRRARARQPPLGPRPRRLRHGGRRRRRRARGVRARQGARRAHLRGVRRLRHERRRPPHHGSAGRRRGRAARDGRTRSAMRASSRSRSTTSMRTRPRPSSATAPRPSPSSARSAITPRAWPSARPSR